MADPKDTTSFFRKVVKFVANPGTDWAEISAPADDVREQEFARGELKAMIERKRRNDFVRKREFDMLRKVRREGLTAEQLAALGGLSRIDESDSRGQENSARADQGVKAKIDEIEQQMVGDAARPTGPGALRRRPEFYNAPTEPAALHPAGRPTAASSGEDTGGRVEDFRVTGGDTPLGGSRVVMGGGLSPLSGVRFDDDAGTPASLLPFLPEPAEVVHDPELDEAVIAFANADFEPCEQALLTLTGPGGERAQHAPTWLVLLDLYRAIGQQAKFESLAGEYAERFGRSAPQWFSMPRLVADASAQERPRTAPSSPASVPVGWGAPERLDAEGVARLASTTMQSPLPWVFDWQALRSIDVEGCARLSDLFRKWIVQPLEMQWLHAERLFDVLAEAAPNGVRDADPVYWRLRLDALRMVNRPDQFDEVAIDYCVTYEVSPPSWEPARCEVRPTDGHGNPAATSPSSMSMVGDVSTSFLESSPAEVGGPVQVASVELSGQLVGDIGATLKRLDEELDGATIVNVSCTRLIRVDFIAAGDLLNWVLARRAENRTVRFLETHRMVALFFGAMGINEHATVKIQTV